jgi:hypothetical protein
MKRQLSRLTFREKRQKENTTMKTDYPSSREKKSPPELFAHNLILAHMKQTKKRSRLTRLSALLFRCIFVVLMEVTVLSADDTAHAQQLLVSNFDQRSDFYLLPEGHNFYQYEDIDSPLDLLNELFGFRYDVDDIPWVGLGAWTPLIQGFRTGGHEHGYTISAVNLHVRFANDPSKPLNLSVSIWSQHPIYSASDSPLHTLGRSQNRGPGVQVFSGTNKVILAPNTSYFIAVKANDANGARLSLTYDDLVVDAGSAPGWDINAHVSNRPKSDILSTWERAMGKHPDGGLDPHAFRGGLPLKIRIWGESRNSPTAFVSLTKVSEGQFKATATTGAPSDIVLPITIINGTIAGDATTVTIPAGSTESDVISVSRTPGTTFPVIADIGNLPSPPAGYTLFKSQSHLPIQVLARLQGGPTPVGERTPQVRDAIVRAAGVSACLRSN